VETAPETPDTVTVVPPAVAEPPVPLVVQTPVLAAKALPVIIDVAASTLANAMAINITIARRNATGLQIRAKVLEQLWALTDREISPSIKVSATVSTESTMRVQFKVCVMPIPIDGFETSFQISNFNY
jgi:hypothetical protein